ncbi:hypothetical protein BJV82DRAFT_655335 [Fennellomyces sp. T-0311]|nr:hypothetical protein BJV82DRAFT_581596 [Fennellomyces sp. T-0311]KAI8145770.1 hypothetical protein BJV82DRAFT_655335 [Fennellomyces sp. T-0311]
MNFVENFRLNDRNNTASVDGGSLQEDSSVLDTPNSQQGVVPNFTVLPPDTPYNPRASVTISTESSEWSKFKEAVAYDCYTRDAFPDDLTIERNSHRAVFRIRGYDESRYLPGVSGETVARYSSILNNRRSNLHSAVNTWLKGYDFHDVSSGRTRDELYLFLMESRRILRENYEEDGRLLCNSAITKCIEYTLLNRKGTGSRLKPAPSVLSKETISLIVCQMLYRLGRLTGHIMCSKEKKGDEFSDESSWKELYKDLVSGSVYGEIIDWPSITAYLTSKLADRNRRALTDTRSMLFG